MKRKNLIIIAIVAVVLVIAILVGSRYYPPVGGEGTGGTIGKAEKFHKGQYTEKDILLRDDILKDTAAVGKTLDQVIAFLSFMQQEKLMIDSLWIGEIEKNCPVTPTCITCMNCDKAVGLLKDYTGFLDNKKETVDNTIKILLAAYSGKSKEFTFDVGVKLLNFVQFIDEMVQRDSVLTTAIQLVDNYISQEKGSDKKRKAEIHRLKIVRDKMVIDNLLFAMKTGDKKQAKKVSTMKMLSNVEDIKSMVLSNPSGTTLGVEIPIILNQDPSFGAFLNQPGFGVYGASRFDAAAGQHAIVSIDASNNVFRVTNEINTAVGLNQVVIDSHPGSVNLVDLTATAYNSAVQNISSGVVINGVGTVFNAETIDNVFVPK